MSAFKNQKDVRDESLLYSEWSTINATDIAEEHSKSILYKLRTTINGQGVVNAVVKSLVTRLNLGSGSVSSSSGVELRTPTPDDLDYLQTDRDVQWVLEVICYGLSLPIHTTEQHEAVRDCVHIYCEWMHAMTPSKSKGKLIPFPIRDDPNRYFRMMIQHLYNVFIRRPNPVSRGSSLITNNQDLNSTDVISRQAVLCHRILRQLESICEDEGSILDRESWDSILIFLLAINDTLLSAPTERDDIGTTLCTRVVTALFEVWLIACHRCFPTPSFWKTFHELCITLRHRQDVIDQWSRLCLALTQRLVQLAYSTSTPNVVPSAPSPSPALAVLADMPYDVVSQTWFRFLHAIGNPVDLCYPNVIAKTLRLNENANGVESIVDPRQHPCLNVLPENFRRAMKGLSGLVNIFLGVAILDERAEVLPETTPSPSVSRKTSHTHRLSTTKVPFVKQLGGSVSRPPSSHFPGHPSESNLHLPPQASPSSQTNSADKLSASRPKVNSILNMLGNWLFGAASLGSDSGPSDDAPLSRNQTGSVTSLNSIGEYTRRGSLGASSDRISIEVSTSLLPENFEAGQAEAIGALCRLFCSKRTEEDISSVYLAKFYLALQHGLSMREPVRSLVVCSVLTNSTRLFQLDLNGINILIPHFLRAMEFVVTELTKSNSANVELRRASISLMLSLLVYPLHFTDLPIKDCLTETTSVITFHSLRPRLINLMINALRAESDSTNAQLLLVGFLTSVQDAAASEASRGFPNEFDSKQNHFAPDPESPDNISLQWNEQNTEPSSLASNDINNFSDAYLGREGIPDTARGLFARTLYLVCHYLISNSKSDTQFSLAALEVLSGLARVRLYPPDSGLHLVNVVECKRTTKWVCDFIVHQCSRPPPSHSKDMHSTIVAAYQCLIVWFHEHSYLLQDRECVNTLLEVVELGISGSKSRSGNGITMKSAKELKPASMRVREAAESLLTCLMNHFGNCPPAPCPPDTMTGTFLLDEVSLLKYMKIAHNISADDSYKHYRYFVADSSLILSVLKEPHGDKTVIIIRSAFGKYCWTVNSQLIPTNRQSYLTPDVVPRPIPGDTPTNKHKFSFKYFPDSVERIPLTKLDLVVPTLESLVNSSSQLKNDHEKLRKLLDKQHLVEKQAQQRLSAKSRFADCREPTPSNSLDPVRLILSHFGFLSGDNKEDVQAMPSLVSLEYKNPELRSNMNTLDLISTRTSDTVFVYYIRKGRYDPQEILNSVSSKHYVSAPYMDFLSGLGLVIDVDKHAGWTGNVSSSWKVQEEPPSPGEDFGESNSDHGGSAYDGRRKVIYWADVSHEIAFVVPSGRFSEEDTFSVESEVKIRHRPETVDGTDGKSLSSDEGTSISSRTLSDSSRNSWRNKSKQLSLLSNVGCDTKVLVFWLESIDDQQNVPIDALLHQTTRTGAENSQTKDYFALFVHPLKDGLFRISLTASPGRSPFALPLIDGMVVSKRILSPFVRLTCLNLCRRRRLDADSYQPAHVKRRLKIQDISNRFKLQLLDHDFTNSLFF